MRQASQSLESCVNKKKINLPSSLIVGMASGVFTFSSSICWSSLIDSFSTGGIE